MVAPTYISLFTGAGGLDLAIRLALPSARCVCYVENEVSAAEILAARIAEGSAHDAPIWSDVRTFPSELYRGRVDGIVGGFPCTDLSVAGRQEGITGEKSGLWFEYLRLIREIQPRWVFIENVPGVLALGNGRAVLGGLAEAGFDAEWITLSAAGVGASHLRKRVFIFAWRDVADAESGDVGFRQGERRSINAGWRETPDSPEPCGESISIPSQRGRRELRESPRGDGFTDWSCDDVEHAECTERWPHTVARGCDQPRQDSKGEAAGWVRERGELVEHAASPRFSGRRSSESREVWDGARWSEPSGRCDDVGDSNISDDNGCRNAGSLRRREPSDTDRQVGHAISTGLEIGRSQPGNAGQELAPLERTGFALPVFAPGPEAIAWNDLLVRNPWMRPAIAQAEAESHLRGMADGLADMVVRERTDALRAAGNGVVAICGAVAFIVLAQRAELI